ncbi:MAG: uncharacterized protein JWM34_5088 [Ilumatobacteraceae bacterium]|nr:uncharacterized protein [Ilumatobacteraceae bacterium]
MTITERTFRTPAEALFAILVNPTTYPDWLVGTKTIREVSRGWPRPGSDFTHAVGFGPIAIPDT